MNVHDAIAAGYTAAETAGGDVPLENLTHRADLEFLPDDGILAAAWTHIVTPFEGYVGRGIYPLK